MNAVRGFVYRASFLLAPLTALAQAQGVLWALADPAARGWLTWWAVIVVFLIVPTLDHLIGPWPTGFSDETRRRLSRDPLLRLIPWLNAFAWLALLSFNFWVWPQALERLGPLALLGMVVSLGVVGGILAINTGHELIHRSSHVERLLGGLLLATVGYGVFKVEHVRGHHLRVATADDPATARLGESVYVFVPRAVLGVYCHGWQLEAERLRRQGHSPWQAFWRNEVLHWCCLSLGLLALAVWLTSAPAWTILALALGMGLVAIIELEMVDYIEHYGLTRGQDSQGRVEPVGYAHSWDYSGFLSNAFLLNLQRHADHHVHAGRPFASLETRVEAPQLPTNYAFMLLLALLPPLYRAILHPRLAGERSSQPVSPM